MNTVSLYLYLADVIPSLGHMFKHFGVASIFLVVGITFVKFMTLLTNLEIFAAKERFDNLDYLPSFWWLTLPTFFFVVSALTPSDRTLYLIAGSEFSEVVIQTEEARDIYDDLRSILRGYAAEVSQ